MLRGRTPRRCSMQDVRRTAPRHRVRLHRDFVPAFSQMVTTAIVLSLPVCTFIVAARTGWLRLFFQALSLTKDQDASPGAEQLEEPDARWMLLGQFNMAEAPWVFAFRLIPGLLLGQAIAAAGLAHHANPPVVVHIPTAPPSGGTGTGAHAGMRVLLCGDVVTGRSVPQIAHAFNDFFSWSVTEALLYASERARGPGLFQDMAALHWLLVALYRGRRGDGLLRKFQRHTRVLAAYLAVVVLRNVMILIATAFVGGLLLPFVNAAVIPVLHRRGLCPAYLVEPAAPPLQHVAGGGSQASAVPTGNDGDLAACESEHMHEPSTITPEVAAGPSESGGDVGAAGAAGDDGHGAGAAVGVPGAKCHSE